MGCTASKLDNEDTVRRCKDRRRLIKEAVYARHHLAAAHADYCRSLRLTGSALSTFAQGEPLTVSHQTPAVLLRTPPPAKSVPPSPSPSLHPPPPPPFAPSPTIASSKLPHILSDSSISSSPAPNRRRVRKLSNLPPKLPHILSESSPSSSPTSQKSGFSNNFYPTAYQANSAYCNTPSQASSVWNWENFYPPSPPDSEYFDRKAQEKRQQHHHHLDKDREADTEPETETERSEYDFFQPKKLNRYYSDNKSRVDDETEREEVQCSDWGDHDRYSTTSSSEDEEEEEEDDDGGESRSEIGARSDFRSAARAESERVPSDLHNQPSPPQQKTHSTAGGKSINSEDVGSSAGSFRTGEILDMKMVVRHKDLKEIVDAIKEHFDKAAAAGDQVSEMLEISRAQLDRSFSQLKSKLRLEFWNLDQFSLLEFKFEWVLLDYSDW